MTTSELLWIRCQDCGNTWMMDYQPTPDFCRESLWRLGVSADEGSAISWGVVVDHEGNHQ